jgi:hypothetical protein
MTQIRDMPALLGEDIEYQYPDKTYTFPGDLDVESTYRLVELFQRMTEEPANLKEQKQLDLDLQAALLACFQLRDQSLESLPFGVKALRLVLNDAIGVLGLIVEEDDASPPPKATPNRRSRRSSGSRSSSKSSGSRRTTGGA